jgi:hypothetical protein
VKLRTRKLAAFVTCLGLAAAFPVLSSADKGGIPNANSHKPCPHKGKRKHKKPKPNNHGKKCGFEPGGTTTDTEAPSVSTPTDTETETESTTTTTVSG